MNNRPMNQRSVQFETCPSYCNKGHYKRDCLVRDKNASISQPSSIRTKIVEINMLKNVFFSTIVLEQEIMIIEQNQPMIDFETPIWSHHKRSKSKNNESPSDSKKSCC